MGGEALSNYVLSEEILGNEADWQKMREALERKGMEVPLGITRGSWASLVDNMDVGGDIVLVEDLPIGFRNYMNFPTDRDRIVTTTGRVFLQENGQYISSGEFFELEAMPGLVMGPELFIVHPVMTTDTTPAPFVTSASSTYSTYAPWRAFDRSVAGNTYWRSESGAGPHWIQIKLDSPKKVQHYSVLTYSNYKPLQWALQGSNNGTSFTNLHAFSGPELSTLYPFQISNNTNYLYYRLGNLSNASSSITISEIQLAEVELYLPNTPKDEQGRAMWVLAN